MRRAALCAGIVVLVAALTGAACTKEPSADESTGAPADDAGIFRAGVIRPASLDPAQARSVDELLIADQLFDSLSAYDPVSLEAVPSLASWTATPDLLHWDFTLRPGSRFSDGSPITSADVKATFDRIARKESGSAVSDLLESVSGYTAVAVDATASELAGVVAVSPEVVRIDLDAPLSVLPSVLASPAFGILPKSAVEAGELPETPVGSGPFRLRTRQRDRLSLVPSTGVDMRSKGIVFHLFEDKTKAYEALLGNVVDWTEVPAEQVEEAGKRFGRTHYRPHLAELFYAFNLRSPKFADVRFREAVVRAVDRNRIVADVYGASVKPMTGLVVEGLPARQDDPCVGRCSYDPERSLALLGEILAGGGAVPELHIDYDDDAVQAEVAAAIQLDLANVGIPATLRPKALAEYQQFAVSGEQELFRLGWIAPYASPDAILSPLFLTGFPNNLSGFSSPLVDEPLRAARAEADPARRVELWQAAERAVLADLPIVPIAQFQFLSVASPRVRGLRVSAAGTWDGREISLAPER